MISSNNISTLITLSNTTRRRKGITKMYEKIESFTEEEEKKFIEFLEKVVLKITAGEWDETEPIYNHEIERYWLFIYSSGDFLSPLSLGFSVYQKKSFFSRKITTYFQVRCRINSKKLFGAEVDVKLDSRKNPDLHMILHSLYYNVLATKKNKQYDEYIMSVFDKFIQKKESD